jgi:hypothetical protein
MKTEPRRKSPPGSGNVDGQVPIASLFDGLEDRTASVKYACLKRLQALSETNPAALYPEWDRLAGLLDGDNDILRWGAILCLARLTVVDVDFKIDGLLERLLKYIDGPALVTAANTIKAAGIIAQAQPRLAERLAEAVMRVERAVYKTPECRNVAISHAVDALTVIVPLLSNPASAMEFVSRQTDNPRNAVRRKSLIFLRRFKKTSPGTSSTP